MPASPRRNSPRPRGPDLDRLVSSRKSRKQVAEDERFARETAAAAAAEEERQQKEAAEAKAAEEAARAAAEAAKAARARST